MSSVQGSAWLSAAVWLVVLCAGVGLLYLQFMRGLRRLRPKPRTPVPWTRYRLGFAAGSALGAIGVLLAAVPAM